MPNLAGLERALGVGVDEVAIFAAASETFSRRNINQSIDESLERYADVVRRAAATGCACAATSRPRSAVPSKATCRWRAWSSSRSACWRSGVSRWPSATRSASRTRDRCGTCSRPCSRGCPVERLALHFHDTRGTALANVLAALQAGVTTFDASAGGLGGCPYAPGAAGNLATEDLVYMLDGLGIETGVSLEAVAAASAMLAPHVGHALPSRYLQSVRRRPAGS